MKSDCKAFETQSQWQGLGGGWRAGGGAGTVCITPFCIFGPCSFCSFVPLRPITAASQELGFNLFRRVFLTRSYVELTDNYSLLPVSWPVSVLGTECSHLLALCFWIMPNLCVLNNSPNKEIRTRLWVRMRNAWPVGHTCTGRVPLWQGSLVDFWNSSTSLPGTGWLLFESSVSPLAYRGFCLGIQTPASPQISHTLLRPLAAFIFFIVSSENKDKRPGMLWYGSLSLLIASLGRKILIFQSGRSRQMTKRSRNHCLEHLTTDNYIMDFRIKFPKQMEQNKSWAGRELATPQAGSHLWTWSYLGRPPGSAPLGPSSGFLSPLWLLLGGCTDSGLRAEEVLWATRKRNWKGNQAGIFENTETLSIGRWSQHWRARGVFCLFVCYFALLSIWALTVPGAERGFGGARWAKPCSHLMEEKHSKPAIWAE